MSSTAGSLLSLSEAFIVLGNEVSCGTHFLTQAGSPLFIRQTFRATSCSALCGTALYTERAWARLATRGSRRATRLQPERALQYHASPDQTGEPGEEVLRSQRLTVGGPGGEITYDDGVTDADWDGAAFDEWLQSEADRPAP